MTLAVGGGGLAGHIVGGQAGMLAGAAIGGTLSSEAGQLMIARQAAPAVRRVATATIGALANTLQRTSGARALTVIQSLARGLIQQSPQEGPKAPPLTAAARKAALRSSINPGTP